MSGNLRFITISDNFFAKSGRPLSTLFLPFLDKLCPHTKMQQQIAFPMEISVLKFQTWQFEGKPAF